VIFDIDGTLHDWDTAIDRAMERLLPTVPSGERPGLAERFQQALSQRAFTRRDGIVVDRRYWLLLADPVPIWSAALSRAGPDLAARLAHRFRELLEPVVYLDAAPCLRELHGRFRLGVLTNNPRADATIAALELAPYFDAVVFPGDEQRKPKPEAFLLACADLGVEPSRTAYVGDSISHDVEGAMEAGLQAVWVDRHAEKHKLPEGAFRVASLLDLPALLDGLATEAGAAA
jgi:putative hydrolase of the HAD superfamily